MKKLIVILLLLVVTIPLAACQSSAGNISSTPNSSALAESTIESSKVSSSKISAASSMTEVLGIKGSHYTDVKLSLENRGFDVVHPKYNSDSNCKIYNNNYIDSDSGIRYGCDMTINNNFEIVSVSFSSENINGVNNSTFIDASDNYLEFCSTRADSPLSLKPNVGLNLMLAFILHYQYTTVLQLNDKVRIKIAMS